LSSVTHIAIGCKNIWPNRASRRSFTIPSHRTSAVPIRTSALRPQNPGISPSRRHWPTISLPPDRPTPVADCGIRRRRRH
jgi:hypothetical protein